MNTVSLDISAPVIVVIASGDTPSAQANARGHLFEVFVAKLFEAYGCEKPTKSTVNVKANGYEVDISTQLTLSRDIAIAECKAYTSPLPVSALNTFYGKLCTERFDHPTVHGWFVAIPGLTADGHQLARKLEAGDRSFRLITAQQIYELALEKQWIRPIHSLGRALSDHGILVTSSGVRAVAKELDGDTRLPTRVLVQSSDGQFSDADFTTLVSSDYASGLPVQSSDELRHPTALAVELPAMVSVVGSTEDFEYQFPAAPKFFVGRKEIVLSIGALLSDANANGRVIVLNAQSGWGKSSLALRLAAQAKDIGGVSVVFDTRTATSAQYVPAALREAFSSAAAEGLLTLPTDASFASVRSALRTIQSCWWHKPAPVLVFFDQFENVFRDLRLTQEFRDLALAIREVSHPVVIGFSWKTDLVGLTENYPYRLRDEIRGAATVVSVEPFGPTEVGEVLKRLSKAANTAISLDLRQRLREYSQGLPWLLKKLASHILKQLQAGTLEETLLSESLNIETLFEHDLGALEATEIDALKIVAREAPVPVSDIVERVDAAVVQSLVDQRLLVRVGERLDVYWDIFREFLLTGKVAVEDTYSLRLRALSASNVLQEVVRVGGEVSANDVARRLGTSQNVVFNAARELRQLGILAPRLGSLILVEQLRIGVVTEARVQERVAKALRRHRVFKTVQGLIAISPSASISIDELAKALPAVFPAIEATPNTWRVYSVAFASWFDYSGLVQLRGKLLCHSETPSKLRLLGGGERGRLRTFPQGRPEQAFQLLKARVESVEVGLGTSALQKATTDLQALGLMNEIEEIHIMDRIHKLLGPQREADLENLLRKIPGGGSAIDKLQTDPTVRPEVIGSMLRDGYGLPWSSATTNMAGTKFRSWAKFAGVTVQKVPRRAKE